MGPDQLGQLEKQQKSVPVYVWCGEFFNLFCWFGILTIEMTVLVSLCAEKEPYQPELSFSATQTGWDW